MKIIFNFRTLYLLIFSYLILANISDVNAQCNTDIRSVRDTIACGDSLVLKNITISNSPTSDDFSGGTLSGLWASPGGISTGWTLTSPCGATPSGQNLFFANGSAIPRIASTTNIDASCGGQICFDFRMETQSPAPCDGPDQANEAIYLQYKNNTTGGGWTTFQTFAPGSFTTTQWQNYCYTLPAGATTGASPSQVQFRWYQGSASSPTYDLWGIDNISISLNPPCGIPYITTWFGPNIPFNYNADTVIVSPVSDSAIYSVFVTNGTTSCTDSFTVYIEQPSIISSVISSSCTGSDTLDAQATITANCEYTLQLWNYLPSPGATQPGWNIGGAIPSYHNLDVIINNNLYSNYTMTTGGNQTSISYQIPVTDGNSLETNFTNGGNAANECKYSIFDSQGNNLTPPLGLGFPGNAPGNFNTLVTCPATATYTYNWSNITNGGVSGLSNSNIQNPLATVAVSTQFQVIATDSLNLQCNAIDTVTVLPNSNAISATLTGDTLICAGDPIILNFSPLGTSPFNIDIIITNSSGSSTASYQIDLFSLQTNGSGAITFYPLENTTYSIVNLSDLTGCPASVIDPTLTVVVKNIPNAGNITTVDFCANDFINYDLSTYLGFADIFGNWTPPGGTPTTNGLNFNFDPQLNPAGVYTYTVDNAPCPNDWATVTVSLATPPNAGITINQVYCKNALSVNLASLLGFPNPDGIWTDPNTNVSNPPLGTAEFILTPSVDPIGTYTYTVNDVSGTCPAESADVNISINNLPTVAISSNSTNICIGQSSCLDFTLTGNANFSVDLFDGTTNTSYTIDANGLDVFGNCVTVSPITTTTYSITSITDNNGCISYPSTTVTINVNAAPNAGNVLGSLNICSDDIGIYPLQIELGGGQDLTGYWTVPFLPNPLANSPNFDYDPQTMPTGIYTYTVVAAPCPDAVTNITVNLITPPFSGIANNNEICINNYSAISPYNLYNLLIGPDAGGIWCADLPGGLPISQFINPNTYGVGTFQFSYEVFGTPPCINTTTTVSLTINPEPVVNTFTSNIPTVSQGNSISLSVDMSAGTAPFTINLADDDSPSNTPSFLIFAPNMNGSVAVTPNVFPITTYSIISIIDGNGCSTASALSVPVTVDPYPVIDPFNSTTTVVCYGTIPSVNMKLIQGESPVTVSYIYNGVTYTEVIGAVGQVAPILVNIPLDTANLNYGANTITIISATDNSGVLSPNNLIPIPILVTINPNPIVTFTTTSPEICFGQPAILEFGFLVGTADFNVDYRINSFPQTPLVFNNSGTQSHTLTPNPVVGLNTYDMIQVTDVNGCVSPLNGTNPVTITVNPTPVLDITVSGTNPICVGETSALFFPVTSGTSPYNLNYLVGTTNSTANVDAVGNIVTTGTTQPISPIITTSYTLVGVTDAKGCTNLLINSTNLVVNELPVVDISGTKEICNTDVTQLYFEFTAGKSPWKVNYTDGANPFSVTLSNNSDSISINPSITTTYNVTSVDDIYCTSPIIDVAIISVNPLPEVNVSGGGSICDDGRTVNVIFKTTNGTPTFNLEYNIGIDSYLASNIGYQHIITTNETGLYTVTKATDSKGCIANVINGNAFVNVNPMPEASISAYPQPADITNPLVYFTDQSINHTNGIWDFGDGNTSISNFGKIYHTFSDTGRYIVSLEIMTDSGCLTTAYQTIIIDQAFRIYIPNAFTPNNDLNNDYFLPIVEGVREYDLQIYDRFGERVFMTDKTDFSWDGKVENSNEYASAGNYIYNIVIIDFNGKERVHQGSLILIR